MKTLFYVILGLLASLWRSLSPLTRWAFTSVRGAYAIMNRNTAYAPNSFLPLTPSTATTPGPSVTFADLTMVSGTVTSSTINTGIAGLQWVRLRAMVKNLGGLAATGKVQITVQAGTGTAITGPTNVVQQTVAMETGDTILFFQALGWSNSGFQSYKVIMEGLSAAGAVDTGITAVADVEVMVA